MALDPLDLYATVQRSWTSQDWDTWQATCAPGYTFDPGLGAHRDLAATMAWNRGFFTAFPDYTEEVRAVTAGPATSMAELVGRGTFTGPLDLGDGAGVPPTGRPFEIRYAKVLDYDPDGRATTDRQYHDLLGLFRQLGLS